MKKQWATLEKAMKTLKKVLKNIEKMNKFEKTKINEQTNEKVWINKKKKHTLKKQSKNEKAEKLSGNPYETQNKA